MIITMKVSIKRVLRVILSVSMILLTGLGGISADNVGDITGTTGTAKRKISLEKAVEKGIQSDARYKNRLLDSEITGLYRQKARMKKRFHVDLQGSYFFQSQQMEIVFPERPLVPGVTIPGSTISAGAKHNYDLKLSLVQPIFTGGILSNRVKLETQKQVREKYKTHLRKIEVAGMIKASYFTYRLLESKKKSLSLLIGSLKLHLKKITNLYNEDLVKKSDLLETKIKISEAEMEFEELNQLLEEEKINFARLCGFAVEDIEKTDDEPMETFRESLSLFKTRHPALKTIDQEIRMLFLEKKIVSGNYLPRVKGFAELHYGKPGIDFFRNEWSLYFQGGVSINFRIFDWNQLKSEKQVVDQAIRQLNNRKQELAAEVKKRLAQLYAKKRSVERQLKTVNRLVKFASEDAGLKQELYREQQAANIDFLSALLSRERYESLRNELILQVRLIKLNINTLIGRYGD
ncbi:MAG: TolC family protein [Candidatus Aminicenantes bacterium]|nr:MAG: TolC family protein [Candidatus Aminicenantes bacterium]